MKNKNENKNKNNNIIIITTKTKNKHKLIIRTHARTKHNKGAAAVPLFLCVSHEKVSTPLCHFEVFVMH